MSSSNKPIRVGVIGLSAGGGWAPVAHLPYLQNSPKYTITAVCNSSIESGNKAIEYYNLPGSTKAYDSVESMCDSDTVDLVVCVVVVFSHYKLVKPAIERGKDVYVEWPLCGTTEESKELAQLAEEKGVRTIIGFQSRAGHIHSTLQEVLQSGRIGKVLATHIVGSSTTPETGNRLDKRYLYFKERHAEGTNGQVTLTIYMGHTMDFLASLVGQPKTVSAQLQTTWPKVNILDGDKIIETNVKKTASDYASLHGVTENDVPYTYVLRGGDSFQEGDGLVWDIIGDKGQIRVTGATIMFNIGADNYKILVKDYASGKIETVPMHEKLSLPLLAQNVGMVYERFADDKSVPTFEDAVRRHEFLDAVFTSNEDSGSVQTFAAGKWEPLK
ncbi:hypothetical protein BDV26DRAFT_181210 [Aspergillus bertholletiae]|uniref:Uncharacterized protein n=1 Tax=Aspergillus bertholletiae TaxID=1226010 RepID=A0A5N7BAP7_9EURO|nr:hypothetical protein BDV26DRAFT_181210 [Aspergillus bertholletiae]